MMFEINEYIECSLPKELTGLSVDIVLPSVEEDNDIRPHVWTETSECIRMVDIRNDYTETEEIESWIIKNYDLLMKHWKREISDDEVANFIINERLKTLYDSHKARILERWKECYNRNAPSRINEFGVIDEKRYDWKNGILVIGRETNGVDDWYTDSNKDLFLYWMRDISRGIGKLPSKPNIWYNIARYIMAVRKKEQRETLKCNKNELLSVLGTVAFTNINKVGGDSSSGKAYWKLYKEDIIIKLIIEEIEIIRPKYIILCDRYFAKYLTVENANYLGIKCSALEKCIDNGRIFSVYHPAARMSHEKMLADLEKQMIKSKGLN